MRTLSREARALVIKRASAELVHALGWLVMQLSKELGELSGEIAAALADGEVSPAEADAAMAQLDDLDRRAAQMRSVLRKIMEGGR